MQENLGVKIILLNNNFLGMVRQWQELFHNERYSSTPMINPDFVAIGNAYRIPSRLVTKHEDLDEAIADMLKDNSPYLLVVDVETRGMVYPMIPAGTCVTNVLLGDE
jgi:acetolactate synthase-1/2/3 large subunit